MQHPMISAQNVTKRFTEPVEFTVLDDISLDVAQGEFVVLVGPSGSGKTTLMYALSTLDTIYDGAIRIDGTDIRSLSKNQLATFETR